MTNVVNELLNSIINETFSDSNKGSYNILKVIQIFIKYYVTIVFI